MLSHFGRRMVVTGARRDTVEGIGMATTRLERAAWSGTMQWVGLAVWAATTGTAKPRRPRWRWVWWLVRARWMGKVPSMYKPERTGATFGLNLAVPVGEAGWTVGGGAFGSMFTVQVPYKLEGNTDYGKRMRWMPWCCTPMRGAQYRWLTACITAFEPDRACRSPVRDRRRAAHRTSTVRTTCAYPTGNYDIEDDRIVVKEAENEAPFLLGPVGYASTGLQWSVGRAQPGLVLSVDAFGVPTTTHWRSGMNGSQWE